jgi:Zn-dependent protease with chaperone function
VGSARLYVRDEDSGEPVAESVLDRVRLTDPVYAGQPVRLRLASQPDARLVLEEQDILAALPAAVTRGRTPARLPYVRRLAGWTLALAAVVGGLVLAVPLLARPLAHLTPDDWADSLGGSTVGFLTPADGACGEPGGEAALAALVAPLEHAAALERPLTVRVVPVDAVNAAAAAGGHIVVFNGLIQTAETPDEVAAVLAHEIGHVAYRHPLVGIYRSLGHRMLLAALVGDASTALGLASDAARLALDSAHSRSDEAAADRYAIELLKRAGLDSRGLAAFFRRLREQGAGASVPHWMSSHPATEERMRAAEAAGRPGAAPLDRAQWMALRGICSGSPR